MTVIAFAVSVPVLSVQITVVLPRVSTAGSRRMIALRRAIRATPIASVTVTAAGSPSGIAPTARATAAVIIAANGSPRSIPTTTLNAARPRITTVSTWLKRASLRVSGVCTVAVVPTSLCTWPISVSAPVATTTPRPLPAVTNVLE